MDGRRKCRRARQRRTAAKDRRGHVAFECGLQGAMRFDSVKYKAFSPIVPTVDYVFEKVVTKCACNGRPDPPLQAALFPFAQRPAREPVTPETRRWAPGSGTSGESSGIACNPREAC